MKFVFFGNLICNTINRLFYMGYYKSFVGSGSVQSAQSRRAQARYCPSHSCDKVDLYHVTSNQMTATTVITSFKMF